MFVLGLSLIQGFKAQLGFYLSLSVSPYISLSFSPPPIALTLCLSLFIYHLSQGYTSFCLFPIWIGYWCNCGAPFVGVLVCICFPVAYPISKVACQM